MKLNGDQCQISCELYRLYFTKQNLEKPDYLQQLLQLQQTNQELKYLSDIDDLTKLANRRYFDNYLQQAWISLAKDNAPLAIILCDIDCFKIYNKSCGTTAGDECLRQIAMTIKQHMDSPSFSTESLGIAARFRSEQFAVAIAGKMALMAFQFAESIRYAVKKLNIPHDSCIHGLPAPVITVSLGIACCIPSLDESPDILLQAASSAIACAKRNGRNCTYISKTLYYE